MIRKLLGLLGLALLLAPVTAADSHLPLVDGVRVEAGNQRLTIHWEPVNSDQVAGYSVYIYRDGALVQTLNRTTTTTATYIGAVNGRSYAVQVAAYDAAGRPGPASAPVAATPQLADDAAYLVAGLLVVVLGLAGYALLLATVERRLPPSKPPR